MSCDAHATRRRTKFPGSAAFYASRRPVEQFEAHFCLSRIFAEPRKRRSVVFPKPGKSLSKMRRWRTFLHLDRVFAPSFASNATLRRPAARKTFLTRIHRSRSPAMVVQDCARAPSLQALRAVRLGGSIAARQSPSYGQAVLLSQSHMYKQCLAPTNVRFSIRTACTYNLSPDLEKHKQGRQSKNNAHQNLKQTPNTFPTNHKSPPPSSKRWQ